MFDGFSKKTSGVLGFRNVGDTWIYTDFVGASLTVFA